MMSVERQSCAIVALPSIAAYPSIHCVLGARHSTAAVNNSDWPCVIG